MMMKKKSLFLPQRNWKPSISEKLLKSFGLILVGRNDNLDCISYSIGDVCFVSHSIVGKMTSSYQSNLEDIVSNCDKYFDSITNELIIPMCKKHKISFDAGNEDNDLYWNFHWKSTLDNGTIIEEYLWEHYPEECDSWMSDEDYDDMQELAALLNTEFFGTKIGYLVKSFRFQEV